LGLVWARRVLWTQIGTAAIALVCALPELAETDVLVMSWSLITRDFLIFTAIVGLIAVRHQRWRRAGGILLLAPPILILLLNVLGLAMTLHLVLLFSSATPLPDDKAYASTIDVSVEFVPSLPLDLSGWLYEVADLAELLALCLAAVAAALLMTAAHRPQSR